MSTFPRVTTSVAELASGIGFEDIPADVVEIARQCILDTVGVTVAGAREPVADILLENVGTEGGAGVARIIGREGRLTPRQAALVNGTVGHALDFDDCNLTMPGHVSVVVLPAVLALAEREGATGRDLITAFVAGYDAGCRIGATMAPGHYDRGFHATGTIGTFAAAAGAGRLLGLSPAEMANALSLAGTMAAGLKGLFGTMAKPFHAGRAAENGLTAALLAASGFEARPDGIEYRQGFADTHGPDFRPEEALVHAPGHHLRANLFKYHASCYGTHGVIECSRTVVANHGPDPREISGIVLGVASGNDKTCNIPHPERAAEARFSLRHTAAMVLTGYETGDADAFERSLHDPRLRRLRDLTQVQLMEGVEIAHSRISVTLDDGTVLGAEEDATRPATDLTLQRQRLCAKFDVLVTPVLGLPASRELKKLILRLEDVPDVRSLTALAVPDDESRAGAAELTSSGAASGA